MIHVIKPWMTVDYLMGMVDSAGNRRPKPPTVLRGDPDQVRQSIESCPHKRKFISGVLMEDKPLQSMGGREFMEKLMDEFERTLFPGLPKDSYVIVWIIHHREDGKTELNYCVVRMHLPSGKYLNPYLHKYDCSRFEKFIEKTNLEYNLSNPLDPERRRELTSVENLPADKEAGRKLIHRSVERAIQQGHVRDRASLIKHLERFFTVNRQGRDYVSVRTKSGSLFRLKGKNYKKDWVAGSEHAYRINDEDGRKERLKVISAEWEQLCQKRASYLSKKFGPKYTTIDEQHRHSLRERVLLAADGIARRYRRFLQSHGGQDPQVGEVSTGGEGLEYASGHEDTEIDFSSSGRRFRGRAFPSSNRIHPSSSDTQGTDPRLQSEGLSAPHINLSLFARFRRYFSWRVRRLSGGRPTASKNDSAVQQNGPAGDFER